LLRDDVTPFVSFNVVHLVPLDASLCACNGGLLRLRSTSAHIVAHFSVSYFVNCREISEGSDDGMVLWIGYILL
jgi:hypothetical protein